VRNVLGLGRAARHKILPIIAAVMAYLPAVVFVGFAVLLSDFIDPNEVADYAGFYFSIVSALVLFNAFVAPDVLTSDRRNGLLALYLSTPLTRGSYVAARAMAVVITLLVVTLGPPLLLLIGYTFEGAGPDGFDGWLGAFGRVLLCGVLIAMVYGGMALSMASFTDRRGVATASIVLVMLLGATLTITLVEAAQWSTDWYLLNLVVFPFELVHRIWQQESPQPTMSTAGLWLATSGWIVVSFATVWWRYRKLQVDR